MVPYMFGNGPSTPLTKAAKKFPFGELATATDPFMALGLIVPNCEKTSSEFGFLSTAALAMAVDSELMAIATPWMRHRKAGRSRFLVLGIIAKRD
jgi:hypothetical protein